MVGTLNADAGDNLPAVVIENHPSDSRVKICEDGIVPTLSARMGTGGNNVPLVMPLAYGMASYNSNAMKSANPHSGVYEAETARTLDTSSTDPNKNAGGMMVVCVEGNSDRPSHRGNGISENGICYTLNTVEKHKIAYDETAAETYAMTTGSYTQVCKEQSPCLQARDFKDPPIVQVAVENYQHGNYREVETAGTIRAAGADFPGGENMVIENNYVVRRLTPRECAMLQGLSPAWCDGLETENPTEEDIAFWADIFETHRKIMGKSKKPKTRNQIIKWLKNPYTDSAAYKLYGNGIAIPCGAFVLGGIAYYAKQVTTP